MKKYSLSALAVAGVFAAGLGAGPASAADFGGNCCADLEERIAELESTTARKGNRKVSLTISGWVGEQVMWWDDGLEDNVYVAGLGTTIGTNFKITGQATISPGWTAGYVIQLEADGSDALNGLNQSRADGPSALIGTTNYVHALQSYWFMKSEQLGKLGVGLQSQASDNTAILVDGSGSLIAANFVAFDYGGFFLRRSGATAVSGNGTWSGLQGCTDCNGTPLNSVRYDTPTFAGFSASASWGEDDFWDVALRYAGEWSGFKIALAGAYSESTDGTGNTQTTGGGESSQFFQVGGFLFHIPTGLFAYGAYGTIDGDLDAVQKAAGLVFHDHDFWYLKAGLRQRWSVFGHTVLYGEYQNSEDGRAFGTTGNVLDNGNTSDFDLWGVGAIQEIDNAAMSLWVKYRHLSGESTDRGVNTDWEDFDYVSMGALINF